MAEKMRERGIPEEDINDLLFWQKGNKLVEDLMEEVDEEAKRQHTSEPGPSTERYTDIADIRRCRTWPFSDHGPQKKQGNTYVWEVPTRCFIDPGFDRLDPWEADRVKLRKWAEGEKDAESPKAETAAEKRCSLPDFRRVFHLLKAVMPSTPVEPDTKVGRCCQQTKHKRESLLRQLQAMKAKGALENMQVVGEQHTQPARHSSGESTAVAGNTRAAEYAYRAHDDFCTSRF